MVHINLARIFRVTALVAGLWAVGTAGVSAQVWKDTDVNLATLLEYDFTVVDTNFMVLGEGEKSIEVIYLGKDKKLFRCTTFDIQGQGAKHWCETVR